MDFISVSLNFSTEQMLLFLFDEYKQALFVINVDGLKHKNMSDQIKALKQMKRFRTQETIESIIKSGKKEL